jgi:transposase-like protein
VTTKDRLPETLIEAVRYFSDPQTCVDFVAQLRWPSGPVCPRCEGSEHSYLTTRRLWKCKACKKQFSVKVGTIFEDSALPLDKWLVSIWLIANSKNGISSHELSRSVGITQKSAWFVNHRIRLAMQSGTLERVGSDNPAEVDETFVGGKAKNMHQAAKVRRGISQGFKVETKAVVVGAVERDGEVRAEVVADRAAQTLIEFVKRNVRAGARLYTDAYNGYSRLDADYEHQAVDHMVEYARGAVHTNGIENFWSLLKRGLSGTYVSVDPEHLQRYVDERVYAFNHRDQDDLPRFAEVLTQVAGRRLTYDALTGKA